MQYEEQQGHGDAGGGGPGLHAVQQKLYRHNVHHTQNPEGASAAVRKLCSTCAVCPWGQMAYIMADTTMGAYLYWLRTCVTAGVPLAHTDNAVTAAAAPAKQASKEYPWASVDFMKTP